ncbi:MAG: leucine-rich repeat protein [Clostridia bacterium]|nr:leucine-rich repeat protein [Clostridia bacterium]
MKSFLKTSISFLLAITFIFSSMYVGLSEVDFGGLFAVKAEASDDGCLTYTLDDNKTSYSVHCNDSTTVREIIIPATHNGLSVTRISDNAFRNCYNLCSITIPDSVTEIGDSAFKYCKKLVSVKLPASVTVLGNGLFDSCYNLRYATIGDGVTVIPECLFSYCVKLREVLFPKNISCVNKNAFLNCFSLEKIYYKDTENSWTNISLVESGNDMLSQCKIVFNYDYDNLYSHIFTTDDDIKFEYPTKDEVSFVFSNTEVAQLDNISIVNDVTGSTIKKEIKLDMVSSGDIKFNYGAYYTCNGVYVSGKSNIAGSEFIPVENLDSDVEFENCTYCVWDADKNFIRGDWNNENLLSLNPDNGDAYVTITASVEENAIDERGFINGKTSSCFILTRDVFVLNETKTFEIFGDSISTFDGYNCEESIPFYSSGVTTTPAGKPTDVINVSDTWWKKLENETGLKLLRNDSSSGRCISYSYYGGRIAPEYSFVGAVENRFLNIGIEKPDVFIIYGGTNDVHASNSSGGVGYGNNIGVPKYSDWTQYDMQFVVPALCYILDLIYKNSPESEILFICDKTLTKVNPIYCDAIAEVCEHYAVDVCKVYQESNNGDVHPNKKGMTEIKDQIIYTMAKDDLYGEMLSSKSVFDRKVVVSAHPKFPGECTLDVIDSSGQIIDSIPILIKEGSHQYCFDKIKLQATCTLNGTEIFKCRFCGLEFEQPVPATGHSSSDWLTDSNPTCTVDGGKHKECLNCGCVLEKETIPATGHSSSDWLTDSNPTCTVNGGKHKECLNCGCVLEEETIPATGHTVVIDLAVKPTCTTQGKKQGRHCSVCDAVLEVQIPIDALGHKESDWLIDNTIRIKYKKCTVCGVVLDSQKLPLSIPVITSLYNEVEGIQIKWSAVDDAVKYDVYRKKTTENEWSLLVTTDSLEYLDIEVESNGVYQYSVKALDKFENKSDFSSIKENRFIETPRLEKVSNVVGGVQVSWNSVAGATTYRVYRRGAGSNYWYYLGEVSASQLHFVDIEGDANEQIKSGNYYRYTIRASYNGFDSAGEEHLRYSGFDASGLYLKYMAVPKLKSISNATNGLYITWNAVGGVTNGYRVYRRGAGSTYWTYLGTTKNTYFTDTAVKNKNGEYFRYTVIADGGYHSKFDTTGLYLRRITNPVLKSATSAKAGITVKWGAVSGSTGYYLYRKTANSGWQQIGVVKGANNVTFLDKTAKKGVTYTYTVRAACGTNKSYFNSGISCKDKY